MKAIFVRVVTAFAVLFAVSLSAREWTSSDGVSLEADYISSDGSNVTLKRAADGKTFTLALTRFSAADQAWVKEQMAKPAEPKPIEGPFADKITGDWALGEFGDLPYAIYGAKDLDGAKKYPLLLALHGKSSNDINGNQITGWAKTFAKPENYAKHPCIIVAPLCYQPYGATGGGWNGDPPGEEAVDLVKELIKELPIIDEDRVYVFGHSMGGFGVCYVVSLEEKLFAGAISVAGCSPEFAGSFKKIPYQLFHAADDPVVDIGGSRQMADSLKRNRDFKYTEFETGGHGITGKVFDDPAVREWLFSQPKSK